MTLSLLYQEVSQNYVFENAKQAYGGWAICYYEGQRTETFPEIALPKAQANHPYLNSDYGVQYLGSGNLQNAEGTNIGTIGYIDNRLIEMGNIELYDGRFPENEGEIVAETSVLAYLGLSYELGQTIILQYVAASEEGPVIEELSYTLVGVIRSYSVSWCASGASVLVTKDDFGKIPGPREAYAFYEMNEEYQEVNVQEFCNNLYRTMMEQFMFTEKPIVVSYN